MIQQYYPWVFTQDKSEKKAYLQSVFYTNTEDTINNVK